MPPPHFVPSLLFWPPSPHHSLPPGFLLHCPVSAPCSSLYSFPQPNTQRSLQGHPLLSFPSTLSFFPGFQRAGPETKWRVARVSCLECFRGDLQLVFLCVTRWGVSYITLVMGSFSAMGRPVHGQTFSSIPGLCPRDDSSSPVPGCDYWKCLQPCQVSPGGKISLEDCWCSYFILKPWCRLESPGSHLFTPPPLFPVQPVVDASEVQF